MDRPLKKTKALKTDVSEKEIREFIYNNYPTIAKGQLQDFKYPEKLHRKPLFPQSPPKNNAPK